MTDHGNADQVFAAFLKTLSPTELAALQHEARQAGDNYTLRMVLAEFKRREGKV